jgi:hypothetical protein
VLRTFKRVDMISARYSSEAIAKALVERGVDIPSAQYMSDIWDYMRDLKSAAGGSIHAHPNGNCPQCGHDIGRDHNGARYCSNRCKQRAYRLTGWFGNHDRYGGNGGDRAFFLEAWNGGSYIVDRVKHRGKPLRISRAALAILGGIQPDRLREALAGADDGLAARFAYIWPDPPPISKLANESDETMRDRRNRLVEAARRLHGLKMSVDAAGEPAPGLLRLDRSAFALFDELRQEAMQRARSSRGLAGGWHGKTPGRALRLALVYELLMWSARGGSEPLAISADAMALASGYLDYLAGMFDRTTAGLAISREETDAAAIALHIISTRPTALNERELYQQPGGHGCATTCGDPARCACS